jgi:hypothetical protein
VDWHPRLHLGIEKSPAYVHHGCLPSLVCRDAEYGKNGRGGDSWCRQVIIHVLILLVSSRYQPRLELLELARR